MIDYAARKLVEAALAWLTVSIVTFALVAGARHAIWATLPTAIYGVLYELR